MMQAAFNSFSYWATFTIIWLIVSPMGKASHFLFKVFDKSDLWSLMSWKSLKPFLVVFVSIANISSFLQVAFMFDMTGITGKMDSQILTGCLIATILQTSLPLATEFTLASVYNRWCFDTIITRITFIDDVWNSASDDQREYRHLLRWWPRHPGDWSEESKLGLTSLLHFLFVLSNLPVFLQTDQIQETQN